MRTDADGSFSDGLSTNAFPHASAGAHIHIGTIAGKLNGVIPPTTPSGWRIEYTSIPVEACSEKLPLSSVGIPQQNSITSSPRATSPSASEVTLPCSSVSSRARSARWSSKSRWMRKKSSARRESESARHAGNAAFAAWTARSTSSADAKSTAPVCAPVAGLNTGPVRPGLPLVRRAGDPVVDRLDGGGGVDQLGHPRKGTVAPVRGTMLELAEEPGLWVPLATTSDLVVGDGYVVVTGIRDATVERIRLDDATVEVALAEVRELGRARGLDHVTWWVGERSTPAGLAARLAALGLEPDPELPEMTSLTIDHAPGRRAGARGAPGRDGRGVPRRARARLGRVGRRRRTSAPSSGRPSARRGR